MPLLWRLAMANPGFQPTGALSAALTIVHWVVQHNGKHPTTMDCKPSNGLMSFMTYYRRLPGSSFSAIISAAFDLASGISYHVSATKFRSCLAHGCERRFPYEGAHIGFCPQCRRRRWNVEDSWCDELTITGSKLRQLGMERVSVSELMTL